MATKLKVRKGDKVKVIAGKSAGHVGNVLDRVAEAFADELGHQMETIRVSVEPVPVQLRRVLSALDAITHGRTVPHRAGAAASGEIAGLLPRWRTGCGNSWTELTASAANEFAKRSVVWKTCPTKKVSAAAG